MSTPPAGTSYNIGRTGILYSVTGLNNDPTNPNLAYIYATDKTTNGGTF